MKLTLNIGMNNNPLHWMYISRRLAYSTYGVEVKSTELKEGEYNGVPESTLVCRLDVQLDQAQIENWVELMCMAFNQECIAVKGYYEDGDLRNFESLIYDPTLEVKRESFNNKYFIE